ncbi:hypothetical protein OF83DRAFT_132465 [Amylostereum chailletii]|nr:hypothetical protein OF83DRAFT_132465 [Amylostereum chailletii]
MHGFTSTNLGKHRLTLNPSSRYGVFNKGKASSKAKVGVTGKSKGCWIARAPNLFSEDKFLGSVKSTPHHSFPRQGPCPRSRSSSSSTGVSASNSVRSLPAVKVISKPITVKGRPKVKTAVVCSPDSEKDTKHSSRVISPAAKSEAWDIESDSRSLPTDSRVSREGEASKVATAVLDVGYLRWSHALQAVPDLTNNVLEKKSPNLASLTHSLPSSPQVHTSQTAKTSDEVRSTSPGGRVRLGRASSLGPWESVSQVIPRRETAFSRYFKGPISKDLPSPSVAQTDPKAQSAGQDHGTSSHTDVHLPNTDKEPLSESVPFPPLDLQHPMSTGPDDTPTSQIQAVAESALQDTVEHLPYRAYSNISASSSLGRALEELGAEDPSLAFSSQPSHNQRLFTHGHVDAYEYDPSLEDMSAAYFQSDEPCFDDDICHASGHAYGQPYGGPSDIDLAMSNSLAGHQSAGDAGQYTSMDGLHTPIESFNPDDFGGIRWEGAYDNVMSASEDALTTPFSLGSLEAVPFPAEDDAVADREDFDFGDPLDSTGAESAVSTDMDVDTEEGEYALGYTSPVRNPGFRFRAVTYGSVEEEIALTLKDHWLPQKL